MQAYYYYLFLHPHSSNGLCSVSTTLSNTDFKMFTHDVASKDEVSRPWSCILRQKLRSWSWSLTLGLVLQFHHQYFIIGVNSHNNHALLKTCWVKRYRMWILQIPLLPVLLTLVSIRSWDNWLCSHLWFHHVGLKSYSHIVRKGPCTNYNTEGVGVGWRFHYIRYIRGGVGLDHALYNARQLQVIHAPFVHFIWALLNYPILVTVILFLLLVVEFWCYLMFIDYSL